jgi:hypothetical protein
VRLSLRRVLVACWLQMAHPAPRPRLGQLTMATNRQITANRRNARKSTGPKLASGKKQSSEHACRHGLSISGAEFEKQAEILAPRDRWRYQKPNEA